MSTVAPEVAVSNPALVEALLAGDPGAVARELPAATLLVGASMATPGAPAVLRSGTTGEQRPLLWAFTDPEALRAWDRHPAEFAVALSGADLLAGQEGRGPVIAINAAGPGAFVLDTAGAVRGGAHGSARALRAELAAEAARHAVRVQAGHAHDRGRQALAAGNPAEAAVLFEQAMDACGELGDRLHGAAAAVELAACRARLGAAGEAVALWERAADLLALFGEPDLALAALVTAAETADEAGLAAEAHRMSAAAVRLCAGRDLGDRLVALWGRVDGL